MDQSLARPMACTAHGLMIGVFSWTGIPIPINSRSWRCRCTCTGSLSNHTRLEKSRQNHILNKKTKIRVDKELYGKRLPQQGIQEHFLKISHIRTAGPKAVLMVAVYFTALSRTPAPFPEVKKGFQAGYGEAQCVEYSQGLGRPEGDV